MTQNADYGALMESIYEKATKAAQAKCGLCSPIQHYVCTYHEGWADGFEVALALLEKGAHNGRSEP